MLGGRALKKKKKGDDGVTAPGRDRSHLAKTSVIVTQEVNGPGEPFVFLPAG